MCFYSYSLSMIRLYVLYLYACFNHCFRCQSNVTCGILIYCQIYRKKLCIWPCNVDGISVVLQILYCENMNLCGKLIENIYIYSITHTSPVLEQYLFFHE